MDDDHLQSLIDRMDNSDFLILRNVEQTYEGNSEFQDAHLSGLEHNTIVELLKAALKLRAALNVHLREGGN